MHFRQYLSIVACLNERSGLNSRSVSAQVQDTGRWCTDSHEVSAMVLSFLPPAPLSNVAALRCTTSYLRMSLRAVSVASSFESSIRRASLFGTWRTDAPMVGVTCTEVFLHRLGCGFGSGIRCRSVRAEGKLQGDALTVVAGSAPHHVGLGQCASWWLAFRPGHPAIESWIGSAPFDQASSVAWGACAPSLLVDVPLPKSTMRCHVFARCWSPGGRGGVRG